MYRRRLFLFSAVLLATSAGAWPTCVAGLGAVAAGARSPQTKTRASYPDTAKGLKQELKDMREAARNGRLDQLRSMIKDFEIPDPRAWYLKNYGSSGLENGEAYEKNLKTSQQRLENQIIGFARQDGYFSVAKQDPKKAIPTLVTAPELFLASWKSTSVSAETSSETPFGYFLFVDGRFRWDSTLMWVMVD